MWISGTGRKGSGGVLVPDVRLDGVTLPDGSRGRMRKRWRWACQNPQSQLSTAAAIHLVTAP